MKTAVLGFMSCDPLADKTVDNGPARMREVDKTLTSETIITIDFFPILIEFLSLRTKYF